MLCPDLYLSVSYFIKFQPHLLLPHQGPIYTGSLEGAAVVKVVLNGSVHTRPQQSFANTTMVPVIPFGAYNLIAKVKQYLVDYGRLRSRKSPLHQASQIMEVEFCLKL